MVLVTLLHLAVAAAAEHTNPSGGRWANDPAPSKHLFVDDALFASLSGDVGLVHHRPESVGIVLSPSEPWETYGYIGYHSVVRVPETGEFRLYYDTGWTTPDRSDFHRFTCMATSTDGVSWLKPHLGVSTFMNSSANNIVWPRDYRDNSHAAGTVFVDTNPAAPAAAKYKMVAQWNIGGVAPTTGASGVYMMSSADGISFVPMFGNRSLEWSDTKNVRGSCTLLSFLLSESICLCVSVSLHKYVCVRVRVCV